MPDVILEVCVDDTESFDAAITGGADRIELCASLAIGGLTPSPGLIKHAQNASVPVYAMIRPRAGDFIFSSDDIDAMLFEIDVIRDAGLAGVVLGVSLTNAQLDAKLLKKLCDHAAGLGITLHRAIDLVPDISEAIEIAVDLGFERILSSGTQPTALAGVDTLRQMHELAADRITIMPGSGVSIETAQQILRQVPTTQIHASCAMVQTSVRSKLSELGFMPTSQRKTTAEAVLALKKVINS